MIFVVKIDCLSFLGQSDHRDIFRDDRTNYGKLRNSAVQNDEIRSTPFSVSQPSFDYLLHSNRIRSVRKRYVEVAIIGCTW